MGQPARSRTPSSKKFIGLTDDQIADMQRGKPVAKVLPTQTLSEVAVFGGVYIHASRQVYLRAARNVNGLRDWPNYLGVRQFSTPPKSSDLDGFILEEQDVKDLKNCRPSKCELQLSVESIEEFKTSVNWSAPDVAAQVNTAAQKMALEEVARYQKDGNSALGTYYDKEHPLHVIEQFESLLSESSSLSHYLPDLKQYLLGYPHAQLPSAENVLYWERVKFGLKPTLGMNHMVIYRGTGPSGPLASVAIKQLYASHYFRTALDLAVCAADSSRPDENGFYLITVRDRARRVSLVPKVRSSERRRSAGPARRWRIRSRISSGYSRAKRRV